MTLRPSLPAAIVAALCIAFPAGAQQPGGTKIAVVNNVRCFTDMQETKDLNAQIENTRKQLAAEQGQREANIKKLSDQREQLKPGSPQYDAAGTDLRKARLEAKAWADSQLAEINYMRKQQTKVLFDKIQQAVIELATQRQIDLVITEVRPEIPDDLDRFTLEQVQGMLSARNILYAAPRVDITNDVIAALDAKYKATKR